MSSRARLERKARAIVLRSNPDRGSPLEHLIEEIALALEHLDRARQLFSDGDAVLEERELQAGTALLRLHNTGASAERERLTDRLQQVQNQRRRLRFETEEAQRQLSLELLKHLSTHALLQP